MQRRMRLSEDYYNFILSNIHTRLSSSRLFPLFA
nr:MAG TPA: hypothetical protein [Caudoviricetes sp.]